MMSRSSTNMIYQVQRIMLIFFFTVTMLSLSIPLIRLVTSLSDHLYPLVITLILYMTGTVVLASFIHTASYIPYHLASAFDPIKNDIAAGIITSEADLAKRIAAFTVEFFDFAFLDIEHAFVHTEKSGIISHEELQAPAQAMEAFGMLEMSRNLEDISRAGKVSEGGREFHLYILPIWFGTRSLGYAGLMSRRRIGRFSQQFLIEFENNFLDDQFMLVNSR